MLPDFPLYSLRQSLINRLQCATGLAFPAVSLPLEAIDMLRESSSREVVYKSAIAFKLAGLIGATPPDIATKLLAYLLHHTSDFSMELAVKIVSGGWMYFYWSDLAIANCWQSWINLPFSAYPPTKISFSESEINLFPLQYVHARCCSILRLAGDLAWIQHQGNLVDGASMPLMPQLDRTVNWNSVTSSEFKAIAALIDLGDCLLASSNYPDPSPTQLHKSAMRLAESVLDLERQSCILEENTESSGIRANLFASCRASLAFILKKVFDTIPLTQL
jgi:hypothetical protein